MSMFFYFFLFIGITYLLFEVSCMYVCYLLFPINKIKKNNEPSDQANRLRNCEPPVGCYHLHPPTPFIMIN